MRQVNAIIPSVAYHDNALYFSAFYIDLVNHAEEKLFVELCKYDVEKNEMRVLGEELDDTVGLSVCRDRILYPCQGKLWCYDTKTGEKSIAAEEAMTTLVCCQTEQLLLTADDVYYSCIPGEAPKQIAEKEKLGIQAIFPNVIYAYNYDTPTGNGELVYWETVDFLNGNLNAMKTFE